MCPAAGICLNGRGNGVSLPLENDLGSKEVLALSTEDLGIRWKHALKSVSSSLPAPLPLFDNKVNWKVNGSCIAGKFCRCPGKTAYEAVSQGRWGILRQI